MSRTRASLALVGLLLPLTASAGKQRVMLHPSQYGGWTTLAWQAPTSGTAELDITMELAPGCASYGFDYQLVTEAGTYLMAGSISASGDQHSYADAYPMTAGERLYLRVNQGDGSNYCDWATPTFTVVMDGVTYDAGSDLVSTTQGNNGWYYLFDLYGDDSYGEMSFGTNWWGEETWRYDDPYTEASVKLYSTDTDGDGYDDDFDPDPLDPSVPGDSSGGTTGGGDTGGGDTGGGTTSGGDTGTCGNGLEGANSYDVDPDLQLTCYDGYIAYDWTDLEFSSDVDGNLQVDGDGTYSAALVPLSMTGTLNEDGSFSATQVVPGACEEHYTLTGQFDASGDWAGTFEHSFIDTYGGVLGDIVCGDCTDGSDSVNGYCTDTECTLGTVCDGGGGVDTDGDGICDATDVSDVDNDGVADDCDAFPDDPTESADADGDGVGDNADDCDDDPSGSTLSSWYADFDGDGWGDAGDGLSACSQPESYVGQDGDCNDDDATVNPGASEACNGSDDNCDGTVPDDELDLDGDSLATCAGDCDDLDDTVLDTLTWYADDDADGLGDAAESISAGCEAPEGYVADSSDLCPVDPENDADDDGICEVDDNCDDTANSDQSDIDGDGDGDLCDADIDGDGLGNDSDNCIYDANADQADLDGDGEGDVCDDDLDGDGVLDAYDSCLDDSVGGVVDATGCSIEQLCPCDNDWKNHGAYTSAVAHTSQDFVDAGLITESEKGAIQSEAGGSDCGQKTH